MANISIYLNGQQTAASLQWEDITVAAQWREGSASAIAEIENADFVKESARIIADWINQGKIFNKLPIQIFATNSTSTKKHKLATSSNGAWRMLVLTRRTLMN